MTWGSVKGDRMRLRNKVFLVCISAAFYIISVKNFGSKYKDHAEISSVPNISENLREHLIELKNHKYILLWTRNDFAPFSLFKEGNKAFIENRCPIANCYVTNNRRYFGHDLTKFDAIAFNGRNLRSRKILYLRTTRSSRQKYIYFNQESSEYSPCCNHIFDGFFNWTATFKLNSDIVFPYFHIKNKAGELVGPKVNIIWNISKSDGILRLNNKKAAAVWIASDCVTRSKREGYVMILKEALKFHKLRLDIYGSCGSRACSWNASCDSILKKYYFYLSFENAISEDYVTEKVFTALKNNIVPVVYGGADYSRFLPPASYLDATKQSPKELALKMSRIIKDPRAYNDLFNWRHSYSYSPPEAENVCRVCAALNDQTFLETKTEYQHFRSWWNPDYVRRCKEDMRSKPEAHHIQSIL